MALILSGKKKVPVGLVAQEVENVLPEIVSEDANGYRYVEYDKLTPLLVEAIKELNKKVEACEK